MTVNTRRSLLLTKFVPKAENFIRSAESSLASEQLKILYEVLVSYDRKFSLRLEKSLDDFSVLEYIKMQIQEHPRLIASINKILPPAYAFQQVAFSVTQRTR